MPTYKFGPKALQLREIGRMTTSQTMWESAVLSQDLLKLKVNPSCHCPLIEAREILMEMLCMDNVLGDMTRDYISDILWNKIPCNTFQQTLNYFVAYLEESVNERYHIESNAVEIIQFISHEYNTPWLLMSDI